MFETFVFQAAGDALGHIPVELRGILGTMSPAVRGALRQRLKASFLKSP